VAGKGVGLFQDWQEIELFIKVATVTMPDKKNHVRYKKLFEVYREVYEKLKSTYPTLIRAVS
jgi:xylulokinase